MFCFSVAKPSSNGRDAIRALHAVAEFVQYEIGPEGDHGEKRELQQVNILGLFFVDSAGGSRFDVVHPYALDGSVAVDLVAANAPGRVADDPKEVTDGVSVLGLLAEEAPAYFRSGDGPGRVHHAVGGAFPADPTKRDMNSRTRFRAAKVSFEKIAVVPKKLELASSVPWTCYRSGPVPRGKHVLGLKLTLPVSNMTAWYEVAKDRLWVDSPPALIPRLRGVLSTLGGRGELLRRWLDCWERKRVIGPDSYFIFLLPWRWDPAVAPECEVFGSGAVPLWGPRSRAAIKAFACYRSQAAFRLLVNPRAELSARKEHYVPQEPPVSNNKT